MSFLRMLLRHHRTLWVTTLTDIRGRYAGTGLGVVWMLLYPVLFVGVYSVVFIAILRVRMGDMTQTQQVLLMFAGLIPFLGLAEALGLGVGSILSNKTLIKNVVFPIELIPVKSVLVGSTTLVANVLLLLLAVWSWGAGHSSQLLIPVVLILQLMFTIGVMWPLAALNVLIRDLGQVISILVLLLMIISPIMYTVDMVPRMLLPLVHLNPLSYLISLYRNCIVTGTVPLSDLAIFSGVSIAVFATGNWLFARIKEMLPDYV